MTLYTPPTYEQLEKFFSTFIRNECDHVLGILRIQGRIAGPTLGITAMTHGNEPAGLGVFHALLKNFHIEQTLQKGTLYLIVNNVDAAARYFSASTKEERAACRFIDTNMNRLPSLTDTLDTSSVELARARALLPFWKQFDCALDIHSTSQYSPTMIICPSAADTILLKNFPIETVIYNIEKIQIGTPAFGFYGNQARTFEIEAGQHEAGASMNTALSCALSLLEAHGMIHTQQPVMVVKKNEFTTIDSLVLPNSNYRLVREFKNFEQLEAGEIVASGNGPDLIVKNDSLALFCPDASQIPTWNKTSEEALFFVLPNISY